MKPNDRLAAVLLVGLMMFFMVGLYLNIVYQKWERKRFLAFSEPGILSVYFMAAARISNDSRNVFFSLLLYLFILIMAGDAMRSRKYAKWCVLLIWGMMAAPAAAMLRETPFLLLEVSLVYAGVFTFLYQRRWFPGAKRLCLCLFWSVPALCILKLGYQLMTNEIPVRVSQAAVTGNPAQSFLYHLTDRFGAFPAYVILLAGVFADFKLFSLFRRLRSEWGKLTALAAALILGVLVLNGGLMLLGLLPAQYEFAPFLWKIGNVNRMGAEYAAQTSQQQTCFTQILLYYFYAGYLTRFASRDSLLNMEMNALRNRA